VEEAAAMFATFVPLSMCQHFLELLSKLPFGAQYCQYQQTDYSIGMKRRVRVFQEAGFLAFQA
jgi:hypothetical protein